MQYHEAVRFLLDLRRFQVKPGTESVRSLLAEFDDPHEDVTFVQVAGSNGKGSTARMTEAVLREAGLTVGLYTSPHFETVRERARVDGRKIPESAVREFVERAKPWLVERAAGGDPLTFFEVVTAMAVWYFAEAETDVAVLEVGMGGKLDATSVVDPVAAAVTNVSLEHTAVLGDTVAEIAEKKAAVAPANRPLVTGATGDALATIRDHAGSVVTVGTDDADVTVRAGERVSHQESAVSVVADDWRVEGRIPLLGDYQAGNAGIACVLARQVADELGATLDAGTLERGLRTAHWPGRFEVMETDPFVVLDGAHNPGACESLATVLDDFDYDDLHLVFGAMHDKDHRAMVDALPDPDSVVTCRPDNPRSEDPETLARVFENAGADDVTVGADVASAVATASERAAEGDCVLALGSLFLVAEARQTWTRTVTPVDVRDRSDATALLERAHVADADAAEAREESVHRVVRLSLQRRDARAVTEAMLTAGGDCATAGDAGNGELADVVLSGTLAAFERLTARLAEESDGLAAVAADVRACVGLDGDAGDDTADDTDATAERSNDYPWDDRTAVMGILNVTPDSFHDGGEFFDADAALEQAEAMIDAGADIVDVGGESTRPGADEVPVEEEIRRIVPVIEALADVDALLSVDTRKAAVAEAALDAGADVLNDVTGLEDPEMRFLAAERDVPVIVMHSIDAPVVPGKDVTYDDVVDDVIDELRERILLAEQAGVPRENVIVDPGIGFGKSKPEEFELLDRLGEFDALGCPVLFGHSHKSMFEHVGSEAGDNLPATLAATALAADRGADIVRVHDVPENVAAVNVALATRDAARFEE